MTIRELQCKSFNDAAQELSENDDRITTYETLKEFAKKKYRQRPAVSGYPYPKSNLGKHRGLL